MQPYLMDGPTEGGRIELKTDKVLAAEQLAWAGLQPGWSVLDLGCASGTVSRIIAAICGPSGRVVGVDTSDDRVAQARAMSQGLENTEYITGDASLLPLTDGSFDLAWSRFLFEYLPNPEEALSEMVRVTKPGGLICVADLDGNCISHAPYPPALESQVCSALSTFGSDFDPNVGRKLYKLFRDSGLKEIVVDVRPYHVIFGRIPDHQLNLWRLKLDGVRTGLMARGWDAERAMALVNAFEEHLLDPDSITYSVMITVCGRKPHIE